MDFNPGPVSFSFWVDLTNHFGVSKNQIVREHSLTELLSKYVARVYSTRALRSDEFKYPANLGFSLKPYLYKLSLIIPYSPWQSIKQLKLWCSACSDKYVMS